MTTQQGVGTRAPAEVVDHFDTMQSGESVDLVPRGGESNEVESFVANGYVSCLKAELGGGGSGGGRKKEISWACSTAKRD